MGMLIFAVPFDRNSINDALGAAANAKNGNDIDQCYWKSTIMDVRPR
jgi:hypothetical protein